MSIGWGSMPALPQALCLAQMLRGSSAVSPPSGSLKALSFEHSGTLHEYAQTLGNYSIESGFGHFPFWSGFGCFWLYHYFDCCLATGTYDYWCWSLDYSSSDRYWNPVTGLFGTL